MKQVKVYILDDDKDAVARIEILLKSNTNIKICGIETDPDQAIHQIRSNRPDLILLDIEMPGIGGFDLLDNIREKDYSPSVIFITGHDQYAIKAIKESALDYLLKPVDTDELHLAIDKFAKSIKEPDDELDDLMLKLSPREQDVFKLLQGGHTSMQISLRLNISKNTVDTHRRKILKKIDLESTTQIHINFPLRK